MNKDYEVGYGKPPEQFRFKPGMSGNRTGRPKGSKNTYKILSEILDQKITVQEGGKPLKISKRAAMLTQLVNKGIKGDTRAIAVLFPHLLMAEMKEEERNALLTTLRSDDQVIIDTYLESIGVVTEEVDLLDSKGLEGSEGSDGSDSVEEQQNQVS